MKTKLALSLIVALVLVACATSEIEINHRGATITIGTTTRSEAIAILGPPNGRGVDGEGKTSLIWNFGPADPSDVAAKGQTLIIIFDKEGVAERYRSHETRVN